MCWASCLGRVQARISATAPDSRVIESVLLAFVALASAKCSLTEPIVAAFQLAKASKGQMPLPLL